jgi:hypothetical protein
MCICLFSCSLNRLRYHTYLSLGVVPANDPLSECPIYLVGTWLRYHTYLPLGVVPANDPLSKCPTRLVGTGAGQTPLVPTGATPTCPWE